MTREEIEEKVHGLYDELMEAPRKILQIFEDFFGEDKVDMQGYISSEELLNTLDRNSVKSIVGPNTRIMLETISTEHNFTVEDELMNVPVTSEKVLMEYVLPYMKPYISTRIFYDLYILVHFPSVKVTNEYDRYVHIQHLYVKVPFYPDGKGKGYFGLNRAEYPIDQFVSDYMHSHVGRIPTSDFTHFQTPCTGTGPINSTLSTLCVTFEESIWQLFCVELDKYVRVESIAGVPHHRLENIGVNSRKILYNKFNMGALLRRVSPYYSPISGECIKNFIEYLLESNKLRFNFRNGSYGIAMSPVEYIITVSDVFIEWANKRYTERYFNFTFPYFTDKDILRKGKVENGNIYFGLPRGNRRMSSRENYEQYVGQRICTFKGKEVNLMIKAAPNADSNEVQLLNLDLAEVILNSILLILNSDYGRETGEASYRAGSQKYYI